jgi:Contractile injection system tube protein/LysM domain
MSSDEDRQKASITYYDLSGTPLGTIKTLFNPEQYAIDRSNQFASQPIPGQQSPIIQFVRGESSTLNVDLFFDTYTYSGSEDVRKYTNQISDLLNIDPDMHAPPICSFDWGKLKFCGIIERVSKRFTMFNEQGIPVRATVGVTFKSVPPKIKEEDVFLSSPDRTKRRIVLQGDTLWMFASKEYGNPSQWRIIADANNIINPRILKPGIEIVIPPLQ